MQTSPSLDVGATFPLRELEQLESVIEASNRHLRLLEGRRDILRTELDRITEPRPSCANLSRTTVGPGFECCGELVKRWTYLDIYLGVLLRLWTRVPHRREEMALAMGLRGSVRSYVARSKEDLFPGRPSSWTDRFSRPLVEGWYVDTNLSLERMRRLLPVAVKAGGLTWSSDVKVFWRRTELAAS